MAKSLKRLASEAQEMSEAKVYKPQVVSLSREDLMKKLDDDGLIQEDGFRCKVSDLPKNLLLEIISHEQITIRHEQLFKVLLSPVVKKDTAATTNTAAEAEPSHVKKTSTDREYDVLLNAQYSEALQSATHLIFMGQGRSKNNRLFNRLKFFNIMEDSTGEDDDVFLEDKSEDISEEK